MNADSARSDLEMKEEGYFLQNFLKKVTEDELSFDVDFIGGGEFELERIMTPRRTYNDIHLNVTYEELTAGFGPERQ